MGRLEVACRRFALLSGIAQDAAAYVSCVQPGSVGARRGLLAVVTEPAGDHPALSTGACVLVHETLVRHYFADGSISLTTGLLKALDGANSVLLRYNYADEATHAATGTDGAVAVQGGGVRTKRSQVGLTAVLVRPDGQGVYLAQMLPTQAYVMHQGSLSALPEPASWQRPGKLAVTLRRVPDPDAAAEDAGPDDDDSLPDVTLPSTPLGSGPAVEVDLLYRRIEPGDMIAIVSSSLARQLDRPLAEEILSSGSADAAIDMLYTLASERGLAQAHACVMQLGVEASSGVDFDLPSTNEPYTLKDPDPVSEAPTTQPTMRFDALKTPKLWLSKLRAAESEVGDLAADGPVAEELGPIAPEASSAGYEPEIWTSEPLAASALLPPPTQILVQHAPEVPPYKATDEEQAEAKGELEFDGWEDIPPAISSEGAPIEMSLWGRQSQPATPGDAPDVDRQPASSAQSATGVKPRLYSVPTIFDAEDDEPEGLATPEAEPAVPLAVPPPSRAQTVRDTLLPAGRKAGAWVGHTLRGLLPDSLPAANQQAATTRTPWRPRREFIAAGVIALFVILGLSVYTMTRNTKHESVNQFLVQAQQEDLLANQPSTPASEREGHLNKVIELSTQALGVEPGSAEAARLLAKAQATLDTVQGIKRVEPKLLFDLEDADRPSGGQSGPSSSGAAQPVAAGGHLNGVAVTGNDAYVLDSERGHLYRCRLATKDCAAVLKVGDDVGGHKVGTLVDMTLRVGNPVALDNNFVTFAFSPDTSAWQAQPLGGADQLAKPKDLASYDGNIYLLDAVPGQVSKYLAGQYGQNPTSWITDQPSVDQVKDPVSIGIDGVIYVMLSDGKILVMQGGKVTRTIPGKAVDPSPPTELFTSTDTQDLYLLRPKSASISRMSKEGQVRLTLKPSTASGITELSGMAVDEGSGKLYMISGRKVYEANLRPPTPSTGGSTPPGQQPSTRPTAEP
jgi:hypothetical protein